MAWLRVSHAVLVQQSARAASDEGLTRAEEFASQVAHCYDWELELVAEASVSHHIDLAMGLFECPHDTVAGFFQSEAPKGKLRGIHIF